MAPIGGRSGWERREGGRIRGEGVGGRYRSSRGESEKGRGRDGLGGGYREGSKVRGRGRSTRGGRGGHWC